MSWENVDIRALLEEDKKNEEIRKEDRRVKPKREVTARLLVDVVSIGVLLYALFKYFS